MHAYATAPAVARSTDSTRLRSRIAAVAATAVLALTGLFASSSPAFAHDQLVGYDVQVDANDGSATAVILSFNNEIMDVGAEILVTDPSGGDAAGGAPTVAGRDVTQPLASHLSDGEYRIDWRVVSSDGHPISGALILVIEAGTGTVAPAPEEPAEEEHDHGDHEHADEHGTEAHVTAEGETPEGAVNDAGESPAGGLDPLATTIIVAVVAVAAAGAVVAVAIGAKRRRQAFEEAARNAGSEENGRQ